MRILITGGAGFIGVNFIHHLLRAHPEDILLCLDALTYAANPDALVNFMGSPRFTFVHGDITDPDIVFPLVDSFRPDIIVNLAAESHVDRSIAHPDLFLRTNVLGTQVLLDACRAHGPCRFHQVSTDEVYGDLPLDAPHLRFTEASPLRASSPYAASKAAADLLALAYARTYGLDVTITRCGNNYGPYQFPEKLIPRMILLALAEAPLPVYGDGRHIRDWVHVDDHCAAIDLVMRRGAPGEIYNVGEQEEHTNLSIVKAILAELKMPASRIDFVADRPGHDLRYALDATKLSQALGWTPQVPFAEGLRRTIRWYADQQKRGDA